MNKIMAALIAGAFALASAAAMADDKTPPQPVDQAKLKAERDKAKADYAKMTPEEKAAYKKSVNAQKQKQQQARLAKPGGAQTSSPAETKAVKAAKSQPAALPDAKAHQEALKQMEKQPTGGSN